MIRRPPRSTQSRSSAASDVYKRQQWPHGQGGPRLHGGVYVLGTGYSGFVYPLCNQVKKQWSWLPNWARRWARPLSYTHLRAHETDSYLVCRLLLEKKKKTQN